jgi:hypothetical protein
MSTDALRAYAARLRRVPLELPAEVARRSAPQLQQLAIDEYPQEHVRTGATLASIEAHADGPVVIVGAGTSYAQYVDGAIPDVLRPSWISVLTIETTEAGNVILGGG